MGVTMRTQLTIYHNRQGPASTEYGRGPLLYLGMTEEEYAKAFRRHGETPEGARRLFDAIREAIDERVPDSITEGMGSDPASDPYADTLLGSVSERSVINPSTGMLQWEGRKGVRQV